MLPSRTARTLHEVESPWGLLWATLEEIEQDFQWELWLGLNIGISWGRLV